MGQEPQFFARDTNRVAIAAAGLTVLTLVLAFSPSGSFAPTGTSFLTLVAGIVGLRTAKREPRAGGKAMSIVAIIVGALGSLGGLLVLANYISQA